MIVFVQVVRFRLVEFSAPFLGLSSVFRELNCGVSFLALQLADAVHLGVGNLGVVRHVGRLLDGHCGAAPFELVKDGDLLLLIERMLHLRGLDTVRTTKVKGHADQGMVLDGRVREFDKLGHNVADAAAEFGRWRVGNAVIDARRNLSGVCGRWYPVVLDLHRFFKGISQAVVSHDDGNGTAPDPLVWSAGALSKIRVPCIGLLVVWILGLVAFLMWNLLILYELWAGEWLSLEQAHPCHLRPGRPISVSAVPFGPGIDICRSFRFIGAMMWVR